eukprot:CAMPEP_0181296464 /NCGR_PEP_ID=MMETSP1101-20121128/4718_1 /TAXON_ID=46948 /ORGANISM="Rhodomonas abbreviata, Strain Caron Lab Isolate" /LENGTH=145 /DNA_ID=CAMNT_0023401331 /DNA_START=336 /DNA_END=770 /DNA_ORIENTATION=+
MGQRPSGKQPTQRVHQTEAGDQCAQQQTGSVDQYEGTCSVEQWQCVHQKLGSGEQTPAVWDMGRRQRKQRAAEGLQRGPAPRTGADGRRGRAGGGGLDGRAGTRGRGRASRAHALVRAWAGDRRERGGVAVPLRRDLGHVEEAVA